MNNINRTNYTNMMSAGTCESCGKVLDHGEMQIKGRISGVELGLCRTHAYEVNEMVRFMDMKYNEQLEYDLLNEDMLLTQDEIGINNKDYHPDRNI